MKITISEIARLANVSRGTVDRVIHNRGRVSKENEAKVRRVLIEISYKPNIFARGLSLSKTFLFGILMPDTSNNVGYWKSPAKSIGRAQAELRIHNVKIIYFHYDNSTEMSFIHACNNILTDQAHLDGQLIAPVLSRSAEKIFSKIPLNLPYVLFDTYLPNSNCLFYIGSDSCQSGFLAVHLMQTLIKSNAFRYFYEGRY